MSKNYKKVCRILSYFEYVSGCVTTSVFSAIGVSVSTAIFSVGLET